ncbi:MAG TPA: glycosyltransferase family 2 protein [Aquabacterium sp.]|uniref:glycosyltransferase family 2 protein n=1 Tax=Aquabacterium sp. TaxID=1872578 RepID=UPI002E32158F|nr:glycosyltransferase family 2 protein [Aquabacterium sp.]HEX5372953.1 glycosyltransferase family 2 protein [Aquabacterium sp.]
MPTSPENQPDVSPKAMGVVIVNYNTQALTLQCVASLLAHDIARACDIVVVDNASPDGSGARLAATLPAQVRVVQSDRNGGFGAGVNLGIAVLTTELVLVLNPDTYFQSNQVDQITALFEQRPRLGVAGLKLINPDGSLQYSARRFYSLPDILVRRTLLSQLPALQARVDSHLLKRKWDGEPFEADWVMGTGFVVRRSAFMQVGRMDERYFLYFEEVDLCARMWVHGWQVLAVPSVELVHEHQRHSAHGIWSKSGKIHLLSMTRFFAKFGVPWLKRPSRAGLSRTYGRRRVRPLGSPSRG